MDAANFGLMILEECNDRNYSLCSNSSFDTSSNKSTFLEPNEEEYALLYEAPVGIVTLLSIFYGGISVIAVIGNALVIWIVATTRQMHTVTNMYIANLASADVIIGTFCIPFQFQAALLQRWNLPEFMCAFCPFVQAVSVNVSVFTLTAIAVDRHRAIINPLRARPTKFISKIIICSIWVIAIFSSIPFAIALRVEYLSETIKRDDIIMNYTRPFCENINLNDDQLRSYRYYLVFVQYVVPCCVISFVYIQMAVRLWGSKTPGNAQDTRDITLLKNKKKVIKMLIIVVVVFGLCWLPLQTYNILYVTWYDINEYQYINIIWFCCDWLAMSNSCYNPFIYGIYNEKFKREFRKRFSYCCCGLDPNDQNDKTVSVYTRASSIRSNYNSTTSTRNRNNVLINLQQRNTPTVANNGFGSVPESECYRPLMNNSRTSAVTTAKVTWNSEIRKDERFPFNDIAETDSSSLKLDDISTHGTWRNTGNGGGQTNSILRDDNYPNVSCELVSLTDVVRNESTQLKDNRQHNNSYDGKNCTPFNSS